MAACPNCGRQTLRTLDWACQWCGYPLISRAYKKIDKTYKELQEERSLSSAAVDSDIDAEPAYEPEYEAEAEPEPEPEQKPDKKHQRKPEPEKKPKFSFFRRPAPRPELRPEPRRESESRPPQRPVSRPAPEPEPPPEPVRRPAPAVPPVSRPEPRPEPVPPPVEPEKPVSPPEPPPVSPARSQPEAASEPEPAAAAPPSPAPVDQPVPKPEIVVENQPAPVSSIKSEDISEGMEISIDDLDALFRADKAGTNLKLNGKTIVLKGVVEKVFVREHLEIRYIVVKGTRRGVWSARCTFDKDTAVRAARLKEGEAVAVRAKYDGYGKNIIFKDCEVV